MTIQTNNPTLPVQSDREAGVIAIAKDKQAALRRREGNLNFWQIVFLAAMILGMAVDIAIGTAFSTALVTNQTEAFTWIDHLTRAMGALAMIGTLMAVVGLLYAVTNARLPVITRVVAFIAMPLVAAAGVIIAAATGYAQLGSLLAQLWHGSNATGGFSLDPSMQSAASLDAPFWARIASAGMFLGVAIFTAICEAAWLITRKTLDTTREEKDRVQNVVAAADAYTRAQTTYIKAGEEVKRYQDPTFIHTLTVSAVMKRLANHKVELEASRPAPVDPAKLRADEWTAHQAKTKLVDDRLRAAQTLSANPTGLTDLVTRLLTVHATAAPNVTAAQTP